MDQSDLQKAQAAKDKGNDFFKQNNYEHALIHYSNAIALVPEGNFAAVCYANKAFCHIKMENYGLGIIDSDNAIQADPTYVKGYYRKGLSYFQLFKYEESREAFKLADKYAGGKDEDIKEKLKQIKKTLFEREFFKSIERPEDEVDIDETSIEVSNYDGPTFDQEITLEFCTSLMSYLREQKKLHKKYVVILLKKIRDLLKDLPNCPNVEIPKDQELTVCGDTHGQYYDLLNIFSLNGNPSEANPYVFNGDFVDRGSFSVEIVLVLFAWKLYNSKCMHLTRGNHESRNLNKLYGFEGEVKHKYDDKVFELFLQVFQALPLSYTLNQKVFIVHGGLFSKDGVTLADIQKIDRFREIPDEGLMTDMLWSDPGKTNGRQPSKRGISMMFGPDVTRNFLKENQLELIVRSHEMKEAGYEVEHDGQLITIFSAPNYCDQMKNQGAFIRFKGSDMKPKFTQFSWVTHPNVPPMAYARGMLGM